MDEDGSLHEEHETLGDIVVRGDNVIFVNLANPDS
jgi:small nuclear ribonucleoprotein (snRNP)-like protein